MIILRLISIVWLLLLSACVNGQPVNLIQQDVETRHTPSVDMRASDDNDQSHFDVDISDWPTYQHESLGIEVSYPIGWKPVDITSAFVRFVNPEDDSVEEAFNIVNAGFAVNDVAEFVDYIGPTVTLTKTITIDSQPALFMQLEDSSDAAGYQSVVGILTPDKRTITVGNKRVTPELFEQIVTSIRFLFP